MGELVSAHVEKELEFLEKKRLQLLRLKRLAEKDPTLKIEKDRWGNIYYVSKKVNSKVTHVKFNHACGCCSDSALLAQFYCIIDEIEVYAHPFSIIVGEQNGWGFGDYPSENWKTLLRENNIPFEMVAQVQAYFDKNKPGYYEEEE